MKFTLSSKPIFSARPSSRSRWGTHQWFTGFRLQHYAGNFPLWVAPDQVRIIALKEDEA